MDLAGHVDTAFPWELRDDQGTVRKLSANSTIVRNNPAKHLRRSRGAARASLATRRCHGIKNVDRTQAIDADRRGAASGDFPFDSLLQTVNFANLLKNQWLFDDS